MIQALKSEFRKLLSIRSTYVITGLAILLTSFISFWVLGYKGGHVQGDNFFVNNLYQTIAPVTSIFTVLVAILLMAHEYRYNTIIYTLTMSNSRSKVLAAKIIAISTYVVIVASITTALFLVLSTTGHNLAGRALPSQQLHVDVFIKILFYCVGFALAGMLFATLIRNLIFAVVFMFIVPNTVESIATLILKQKAIYLPFSSLSQVVVPPGLPPQDTGPFIVGHLTPLRAAAVFSVYLIIGWAITWYLFLRRDAN